MNLVDDVAFALAATPAAAVATLMLIRIVCPNCGHVGATGASLPRVLICFQCGHGGLIMSGRPASSPTITREEQAAGQGRATGAAASDSAAE
jgi:hypothetical protein